MYELIRHIIKFSNLLVFLLLEVIALVLVFRSNPYPRSAALTSANRLAAWENAQVSSITDYFSLRGRNELLNQENAHLRSQLDQYEQIIGRRTAKEISDALARETYYIPARVIAYDARDSHNLLTIDCGLAEGIRPGQGVRASEGAVGIVAEVSEHYALVVPLIHTEAALSCCFVSDNYRCNLHWNGVSIDRLQLGEVALHRQVEEGEPIVTSGLGAAFPAGIPVGEVVSSKLRDGDSYYTITVKPAVDFRKLRYVQVVVNTATDEIKALRNEMD